jgi:hypothetical protein
MRDPRDARVEAALEEARQRLTWLYQYGALDPGDDYMRPLAQLHVMNAGFPDRVRDYVLRRLDEKPSTKREDGRPPNTARDYWIVMVLAILKVEHGLSPTRRKGTDDPSGSAVVAAVLVQLGIEKLNEGGVATVWGKRRPRRSPEEIVNEWRMPANVLSPEDYVLARRRPRRVR